MTQQIRVKNMVCDRCIAAVEHALNNAEVTYKAVRLGEIELFAPLDESKKKELAAELHARGFELLQDKTSIVIEKIKSLVITHIHHKKQLPSVNFSHLIEQGIGKEYNSLSTLFSSVAGITIERFIILQKLERIKELLIYDELSLSQIAHQLGYSSVQHLSNQFKKNIGMTPSEFKKMHNQHRKPLDHI